MQLRDPKVQEAIGLFVKHARACVETTYDDGRGILGVAAVSTIFSCMLTVGEALARAELENPRKRPTVKEAIRVFYREMGDKSWLVPPTDITLSDSDACELLAGIRNGLAHTISMPWQTMLVPSRASVQLHSQDHWRIVVPDFVGEVSKTLDRLAQECGDLSLDEVIEEARSPVGLRSPAEEFLGQYESVMLSTATSV